MKINLSKLSIFALVFVLLQSAIYAFEPQIKLAGRKDLVLSTESRETVLKVGLTYLTNNTDDFSTAIEDLNDPFAFKTSEPIKPVAVTDVDDTPEPVAVNYDDAAVLTASAANFAEKVRGSIAFGDSRFLQLEGGTMLKPGTSFPVRLPQAKGQTFTLIITEITPKGYTLQIGEATQTLTYDNSPQSGSNSIQLTNP